MKPVKLKIDKEYLKIIWSDRREDEISLRILRDECPCAGCKGETILWKKFEPLEEHDKDADGRYNIAAMTTIGGYAVQVAWKDGHDTGIYSWEYLRNLSGNGESQL